MWDLSVVDSIVIRQTRPPAYMMLNHRDLPVKKSLGVVV